MPPRHLALVLRGGREEPRAVLLADVDDLEGEDIVGRCLLSRPHHPEGNASGHHLLPAHRDHLNADPPLDRPWHPAPRPEGHGHPPLHCGLKAGVLAAEGSVWARAGSEGRCRSGRAFRKQWCGAPSQGHPTLAAPPNQQNFTWMPGAPPDPWLPAGDPHGARVSLGPTPGPRQCATEHFREVTVAVPTAGTRGSGNDHICRRDAVRLGTWAGAIGGRGPCPGARLHPHQAVGSVSVEKKRPSSEDPRAPRPRACWQPQGPGASPSSACRPGTRLQAGCAQRPSHSRGVPVLPLTPRDPRVLPGRKGQALLRGPEPQGLGGVTPRPRARKHTRSAGPRG